MIPELPFMPVVLACAFGSLVCCVAALIIGNGYRSKRVLIAVGFVAFLDVLSLASLFLETSSPEYAWAMETGNGKWVVISLVVFPGLLLGVLIENPRPFRLRLWHAAFVLSGWLVGPILTFLLWLPHAMGI